MAVLAYIFEGVGNEMGRFLWPDRQKSSSQAQNQWVFVAKWKKTSSRPQNDVFLWPTADILKDYARIAAIPGSSFPSRYSSIAPPPVDT